jgi:hypothetical protein
MSELQYSDSEDTLFNLMLENPDLVCLIAEGDSGVARDLAENRAPYSEYDVDELAEMAQDAVADMDMEARVEQLEETIEEKGMPTDYTINVYTESRDWEPERSVLATFQVTWSIGEGGDQQKFGHEHAFVLLNEGGESPPVPDHFFENQVEGLLDEYHDHEEFPWESERRARRDEALQAAQEG